MKYAAILLGIAITLFSCKSDKVGLDEKVIKYKESVALPNGSLTFAEVTDSRCPNDPGVNCVWAGNATVDLTLHSDAPTSDLLVSVKMCLGDCGAINPGMKAGEMDTAKVNLDGKNYTLILTEVNPYPNTTKPGQKKDYNIKLKVEQNL